MNAGQSERAELKESCSYKNPHLLSKCSSKINLKSFNESGPSWLGFGKSSRNILYIR